MSLGRVSIRFYLDSEGPDQSSNRDLDRLLVTYLSSMPAKTRHEWVMSALRATSRMVLAGNTPTAHLLSTEEQQRFRQLSNVLRAMGQGEDLVPSANTSSGQHESAALSASQVHHSAQGDRDRAPSLGQAGAENEPGEPINAGSADIKDNAESHSEGVRSAPSAGLSPLKARLAAL